jgi:cytochrome P450
MGLLPAFSDPQFLANPYPFYRQLHAQGVSGWDEDRQVWMVWGYAEAHEALKSPHLSVQTGFAQKLKIAHRIDELISVKIQ